MHQKARIPQNPSNLNMHPNQGKYVAKCIIPQYLFLILKKIIFLEKFLKEIKTSIKCLIESRVNGITKRKFKLIKEFVAGNVGFRIEFLSERESKALDREIVNCNLNIFHSGIGVSKSLPSPVSVSVFYCCYRKNIYFGVFCVLRFN